MNEPTTNQTTPSTPETASPTLSPTLPTPPAEPSAKFQNPLGSPKRRLIVFAVLFGIVGIIALVVSFASTTAERDLITGFRNLAKNRPTLVNGSVGMKYNDSPNLTSAGISFKTTMDRTTGNSAGSGQLTINQTAFPYEYATINKDHYFKLSNTLAASTVVKPSSQAYSYLSSHQEALSKVNNQWLVERHQTGTSAQGGSSSPYACVLHSDARLTASDAQQLQQSLLKNSPVKVQSVSKVSLNGESVTQTNLVMNDPKIVNTFASQVSNLEVVRKIDACTQQVANTKATPKVRDAFKNNNVKISIYMNSSKVIKKITIGTAGKKSSLQLTANFSYVRQPVAQAPAGAVSADDFIRRMTSAVINDGYSDVSKEKDLYTINVAIEKYIETSGTWRVPASLSQLNITGLRNPITTYEYTPRPYQGGPTVSYLICANFQKIGIGGIGDPNNHNYALAPATFTIHKAGKGCYDNGYYKGDSHFTIP